MSATLDARQLLAGRFHQEVVPGWFAHSKSNYAVHVGEQITIHQYPRAAYFLRTFERGPEHTQHFTVPALTKQALDRLHWDGATPLFGSKQISKRAAFLRLCEGLPEWPTDNDLPAGQWKANTTFQKHLLALGYTVVTRYPSGTPADERLGKRWFRHPKRRQDYVCFDWDNINLVRGSACRYSPGDGDGVNKALFDYWHEDREEFRRIAYPHDPRRW